MIPVTREEVDRQCTCGRDEQKQRTDRQTDRQTERETDRQRQRDRQRETDRERQTDTQRERERERDRQAERQTDRERQREHPKIVLALITLVDCCFLNGGSCEKCNAKNNFIPRESPRRPISLKTRH